MDRGGYEIIPLVLGEFPDHEKSMFTYGRDFGVKIRVPILAFLIRGRGRNILVDTGCADAEFSLKHHRQNLVRTGDMEILKALARQGLAREDLECVVCTHLHWDHCYNNPLFAGKRIYAQRGELAFAENPLPAFWTAYEFEAAGFPPPPWKENRRDIVPLDGDAELAPGLRAIALPGHTPGFQGVLAETREGPYLIAGDLLPLAENWKGDGVRKHLVTAMCWNMSEAYRSLEKIERLGLPEGRLLCGHEPSVPERAAYP